MPPVSLMRALAFIFFARGVACLGFAIFELIYSGFNKVFFGALLWGSFGIIAGLNSFLQSNGLVD